MGIGSSLVRCQEEGKKGRAKVVVGGGGGQEKNFFIYILLNFPQAHPYVLLKFLFM